jgi:hypothetical protein
LFLVPCSLFLVPCCCHSAFLLCCHVLILISFAVRARSRLALHCLLRVMDRCTCNDLGRLGLVAEARNCAIVPRVTGAGVSVCASCETKAATSAPRKVSVPAKPHLIKPVASRSGLHAGAYL